MTTEIGISDDVAEKLRQVGERLDGVDFSEDSYSDVIEVLLQGEPTDEKVEQKRSEVAPSYVGGSADDASLAERQSSQARLSGDEQAEIERQRQFIREKYVED